MPPDTRKSRGQHHPGSRTQTHHSHGGTIMFSLRVRQTSAALVALVAAYVSYLHIVAVALAVGERPEIAYALPVTIDALMIMCTLAWLADRHDRWAQAGFLFGAGVSLVANVSSAEPTWPGRAVAAIPAVTLILAVEVLIRSGGQPAEKPAEPPAAARLTPVRPPRAGKRRRRGEGAAAVVAAMAAKPDASIAELARIADVSRSTVRRANGSKVTGS